MSGDAQARLAEMKRRWDALEARQRRDEKRARTSVIVALAGIAAAIAADIWARRILGAPAGSVPRTIRNVVGLASIALALVCYGLHNRFAEQAKAADRALDQLYDEVIALRQASQTPKHKQFAPRAGRRKASAFGPQNGEG